MGRKTDRRHRQGDQSRLAILDATLAIAAERGYDGTTVALVQEATGLPASSIYWHFGSKDALLAATLEHSYRSWRDTAPTWVASVEPEDLSDRVERRFQRAAQALTTSPQFWSLGLLLTLQQRVKEPAARRLYADVRTDTEAAIRDWWATVLSPDACRAEPELTTRLARFHMMLMDGLFLQVRSSKNKDVKRLVSITSRGLGRHLTALGVAS
ncbi:TetR/AcrR family transcriptional regulator [Intrasporangium calvum]|uniref:Regulatory protein TetR n=1 Tax=Intrasporangium calvum (strain ATCC 23552 / DSM 43043 / JCM 3097 / NBRC 12989 / NCIMB 10167 / NRRL B-3866 / 7 KIP) TaxID=710696 RepID=E6SCN6_INTC7|nr:TetR/AcrR family transcriptional regulator [Intrasporangium calvum]ADU49640.1 regulatory protein TetR [Intrasporangium calvum DSM 43043]